MTVQIDAMLRGPRALWATARFYHDPIACGRWLTQKHGRVVAIAPARAAPPAFFVSGAAAAEETFDQWDSLRPTGLWPVKAPADTIHERMRFNFLCLAGEDHAHYARQTADPFRRTVVEAAYARQAAVIERAAATLQDREPIDFLAFTRRLAIIAVFDGLFGERDPERAYRIGDLLDAYHTLNWSRLAMTVRLPVKGTPYRAVLDKAEEVRAEALAWLEEGRWSDDGPNLRAAIAELKDPSGAPASQDFKLASLCTLAWAGFDTPWLGLFWSLAWLAQRPELMARLRAELADANALDDPDPRALGEMTLLNGLVYEAMRLSPPAPFMGLRTVRPARLFGAETPAGATLFLSAYETHRDPALYTDPESYRPERWSGQAPNAFAFLAFSGGVRRCPGYSYAMLFLRRALAAILARGFVSLPAPAQIPARAAPTLCPSGPVVGRFTAASLPQKRSGRRAATAARRIAS